MASILSRTRDRVEEDLEDQVARLTREVARLKKSGVKRGSRALSDARDGVGEFYEEMFERFVETLPAIRKGARKVNRSARENPAMVAAAGVVVLGLVAALIYRR